MAKEERQINLRIKDGDQFYANETGINFSPTEIILDFKCISNVQDIENHRGLLLKHNVVILMPYLAKSFLNVLSKAISDYETKFGEIKRPKELDKADKIIKQEREKTSKEDNTTEPVGSYFG